MSTFLQIVGPCVTTGGGTTAANSLTPSSGSQGAAQSGSFEREATGIGGVTGSGVSLLFSYAHLGHGILTEAS